MGHQLSRMRNSIEIKPYDLFQVIRNESDEKIIRLIKNNTEVAALAFSFATAKDLSNTDVDNKDKCNCSEELERCLPTTSCSTEDMISRFENCLKTGCCPHVVPLEHNDASRTVSGFYWIHLAIILNKYTLVKELTPFFFMSMNKSNMNWFTVHNGYSILYLLLVHNRSHMQREIIKYIDKYDIRGNSLLPDNKGYYEAIIMDNVDVLRVMVLTNHKNYGMTKGFDLAFDLRSYESIDFLVNYYRHRWVLSTTLKLEYAIISGDVRLTRIMLNAFRKQGYPKPWNTILGLFAKKVLERELPIVQAIVDTLREPNTLIYGKFQRSLFNATFKGYPLIKWVIELEVMTTEMRKYLLKAGFRRLSYSKIHEGPVSIISLVIDDRKWAFEDVKCLIRQGHDVNKYDQKSSRFNECRKSPFHVALLRDRYDIAKLLLLNGAQPLPTDPDNLKSHMQDHFREETFYLLITCNTFLSIAVEGETLLRYLLKYRISEYPYFHDYTKMILLILDKIDIFCYEDRNALLDYQNDKSLPNEILEKIHTILYEPDSLMNICRKRLHRHYRCHLNRFIDILIDEALPKFITDYLQCRDLLLKYFNHIEYLDNRFAGIS